MSLNFLKSKSTSGRTCRGTWLRCMRSAPRTRTSFAPWAMRGAPSRSEASDPGCTQRETSTVWRVFRPGLRVLINWCFFPAACPEKTAGHHRAPPAEEESVCHVQQQQVVLHSLSYHLPIPAPSHLPRSAAPRRDIACLYPHHHGNPSTTLHHVFLW